MSYRDPALVTVLAVGLAAWAVWSLADREWFMAWESAFVGWLFAMIAVSGFRWRRLIRRQDRQGAGGKCAGAPPTARDPGGR